VLIPGQTPRVRNVRSVALSNVFVGALLLVVSACGSSTPDTVSPPSPIGTVLTTADFPASLAVAPEGSLYIGELATGRIIKFEASLQGPPSTVATLPVTAGGGFEKQVGLTGLTVSPTGRLFAAWMRSSDDHMVVSEVVDGSPRDVWVGPASAQQASAGRLVWWRDRLVISIGDRLIGADPDPPLDDLRSAIITLDPDQPSSQVPAIVSTNWNNPFALTVDASDRLLVADNVPGGGPERFGASVDLGQTMLSDLGSDSEHVAPSGLAEALTGKVWICGWISQVVTEVPVGADGTADWAARSRRDDIPCSLDVVRLPDGRMVVSTDSDVRVVPARA